MRLDAISGRRDIQSNRRAVQMDRSSGENRLTTARSSPPICRRRATARYRHRHSVEFPKIKDDLLSLSPLALIF